MCYHISNKIIASVLFFVQLHTLIGKWLVQYHNNLTCPIIVKCNTYWTWYSSGYLKKKKKYLFFYQNFQGFGLSVCMKQGYHQWFTVDFNIDWRPIAVSDPDFNENAAYGYSFFEIILFWFDLKVGSNISRRRDCVLPLS